MYWFPNTVIFLWCVFKRGSNESMRKSICWIIHSMAEKNHISENLNSELNNLIRGHLCAYWYHLYSLRDDSKLLFFGPSTPSNSSFVHTTNKHKKGDELGWRVWRPYENTTNTKVYSKCIQCTMCPNSNC